MVVLSVVYQALRASVREGQLLVTTAGKLGSYGGGTLQSLLSILNYDESEHCTP
jgi:hypothetical protein